MIFGPGRVTAIAAVVLAILAVADTARAQPTLSPAQLREISGKPRIDDKVPAGTYVVRVIYGDRADGASEIPVTLVGYGADLRVSVAIQRTDREGNATFASLDKTGSTAYFAMALVPRARITDRLAAEVITLEAQHGERVLLVSETRKSTTPAIDNLAPKPPAKPAAADKVDVEIQGVPDASSAVTLVDAATGTIVATTTVTAPATHAVFDKATRGTVLYAETTARGERVRSLPFQHVGGTAVAVVAVPRLLVRFQMIAAAEDPLLAVTGRWELQNNSWIPYRVPNDVPLPRGFQAAIIRDADQPYAKITATGFQVVGPLPPGGRTLLVGFALPAVKDKVAWALDLPYGTFDSSLAITRETGMTVDAPPGVNVETRDDKFMLDRIAIPPKKSMQMAIGMPKLPPAEKALRAACDPVRPDRQSWMRDKPMPDFTAPQLDGTTFKLSSLKGKLVVVNMAASWNSPSKSELPTFGAAMAAIRDLAVVVVAADNAADARGLVGAKPPYRVVLDQPVDMDHPIGPITKGWKVNALPESFVVDRSGVVRMYFVNLRDWSSPEMIACLKALK